MPIRFAKYLCRSCTLLACWMVSTTSVADTLAKIRQSQTITIAYRESSVPFSYLNDDKKPVGHAIDLCLKITEAVRQELKLPQLTIAYLPVTSYTRIPAIVEGKADLECGSTTNNAERRKQVAFTIPHFVATVRMLVRADSGISNWSDLRERRVVTTKGATTVKLLTERDKVRALRLKMLEGSDHGESFLMVQKAQADAFPMDDVLLYGLRANTKEPGSFNIVGDPLSTEPYAIMLRRDDAPFKALVDREMGRIINDGEFVKLYDKWFKRPIPPKNIIMNMPMGYLLRDILRFPTDKVGD
jgi:ABC-type amino acid transport substrate-binding protein